MLSQSSTSLLVSENSLATAIGIAAPVDTDFGSAALTVTVTTLPSNGTVLLADGVTPVNLGQTLTVQQLAALRFRPALNIYGQSSSFAFTVSDPGGASVSATAALTIEPTTTPLLTTWTSLSVPQNTGATPVGILAPSDANYASSALNIKITGLPTNGTVVLADGSTAVTAGETLTAAQLTGLMFKASASGSGRISDVEYRVSDPGGHTATGSALLVVGPTTLPVVNATQLTVAANSGATPIGILAPTDASFAAPALSVSVTGLPTDGTIVLSDGITPASVGQSLTVAQLTGLEFVPTPGASGQSSSFSYKVSDPSGATTSGSATLGIGPSNAALVTTATSLTVGENSGATPIGIKAPSDASFALSQLSVSVTALPTDGTVLLANGSTPVTVGESLTVSQLTGLLFKPTQDNTGHTSSFAYSVSDPADKTAVGSATLTTGPNPIVLENKKPGTPESVWQIDPGQDSTTIQGFTTSISTNLGGRVDFKINDQTGNPNYQINIYRLGYYGGDGATLVTSIQHQSATAVVQPAPLTDPTTGLVDAGNWQVTDSWTVPTTATSGVYVANIIDGTQVFQIPFIVRDDSSHSDIVFQTDDETWQAYNGWGGASVYAGNGPGPGGAAYAVSYNRPITTRDAGSLGTGEFGTSNDMVFGAEYPAIQWLEENGYDVSYISGLDAATNGSLLLNHQVYMEAGHDEYWTDSQRANVQAAADAGVNLVFLSGNEMYWQTRFEPSIDGSGTANRTLVTYKDTHANALIDPTGTATGTFMDPRFSSGGGMSGQPSNELTGTVFQVDSERADVIQIPYDMTQLRFWRNTAVANTAPGQSASLVQNLLGYEWDSSPDNGFRPTSLVDLSSTTLQVQTDLLDYGNTTGNGTATHNLVEYRDPVSGALVFGAGTVFWSWGLSSDHDQVLGGPTPTDPNVQQATVNLLADMGVQPSTLQATLVIATQSTDHTPPTSRITSVSKTSVVEGQSETVTGTATDVGGVIGGVEVSSDGGNTWHPAAGEVGTASVNWSYTFTAGAPGTYAIESRAVDDSINLETPSPGALYTVTPSSDLSLFSPSDTPATTTVNDPNSVELGVKFTSAASGEITGIRFYKGPQNTGTHIGDLWSSDGTLLASATFTNETASGWQEVDFATPVHITAGTTYIASYHTNAGEYSVTDFYFDDPGHSNGALTATGNGLNGVYAYGTGPIFPANVSIVNGDNYWVDVVFNDTSQQPQANNDGGFVVTENGTIAIPASALLANDTDPKGLPLSMTGVSKPQNGTVTFDSNTETVTFVPTAGYTGAANFTYTIGDSSGGSGSGQAAVKVNYPISAQSLFNVGDTPAVLTVNDSNSVELGVKFQPSTTGTITGIRFYKGPQNIGPHVADLWSATGTLLATATFTNESASGWQEVDLSKPVPVTAGNTYVVSYHTNGDYSADPNYFTTTHTNGSLTALASGASGGDGLYAYGTGAIFPTSSFGASNYWVDVVFNGSPSQPPVANDDSGFIATENTALPIPASALLANDMDLFGSPLSVTGVSNASNGTVSYDPKTQTVSFLPTAGYTGTASFTYSITNGQGGNASANAALFVNDPSAASLFSLTSTPSIVTENDPSSVELGVKFQASENGEITGIRFYQGPQNTGPHVADLWSATGTLLATATFTNETASGWQQANFSNPVAITAGTTYVASYHTNGDYSADPNLFATAQTSGPLTSSAGVFSYGSASVFPNNSFNSTSYGVDVVFNQSRTPVANDDSGFIVTENTALSIDALRLLANDTDPVGLPLSVASVSNASNGTVTYNSGTITFVPATGYTGMASFTYSITDGQGGTASANVGLLVNTPSAASLFSLTSTPSIVTVNDPNSIELGVKFQASTAGQITGLRFYKSPQNTGLHVADLWSATGTLLATATFTNEAASGWQQVNFSNPVAITAGTTYVASYHTNGDYSADANLFATAQTSGPLTALADSTSGGNGVFSYGSASVFPNNSFNSTSYGVDVVFSASPSQPPVANNDSGFIVTENTTLSIPASTLLANDTDPNGLPLSITGVSSPSNGTVTYDASTQTVSFVPTNGYTGAAGFAYSIGDGQGTAIANVALDVISPSPVANNDSGFLATENTVLSIQASALLANDTDPNGLPLSITGVNNSTNGTVTYDSNTQTISFVPTAGYSGTASFNYSVTDGNGSASANVGLLVNDPSVASLFSPTTIPSIVTVNDTTAVELGFKFQASEDGEITGIRFYKSPLNTGTHEADLWSATGTLLATATFSNETANGWQQVNFPNPVAIAAGTPYVASYHTNGDYSADPNLFATAQTSGPLTAPASSSSGNGVYAYGSSSLFPTNSFNSTSYGVDVLFKAHLAS